MGTKYQLNGDNIHELMAGLVVIMKLENTKLPHGGTSQVNLNLHDGTKVRVVLSKSPAEHKAKEGVLVEGRAIE